MGFGQKFGKFLNGFIHRHENAPAENAGPAHIDVVTSEIPIMPPGPPQLVQAVQSASRFMVERQLERMNAPVDPSQPFSFRQQDDKPIPASLAQKVFDYVSSMEDIAFKYTPNGCFARAHMMCQRLLDMEQTPSKAWALAPDGHLLTVEAPNGAETNWKWHVAPVLPVEMPNGKVVNMVFDPSIFNGPVTMERWGESMGAPKEWLRNVALGVVPFTEFGCCGQYTLGDSTNHGTDREAAGMMADYKKLEYSGPRSVHDAKFNEFVLAESNPQTKMVSLTRPEHKTRQTPKLQGGQQQKRGL